jgi:hypothetical protein
MSEVAMSDNLGLFCNACQRYTHHTCRRRFEYEYREGDLGIQLEYAQGIWEIWQCNGCDMVLFREKWIIVDGADPENNTSETCEQYPKYLERIPKHFYTIPDYLNDLYKEVVSAFNYQNDLLCTIGLRTLLEGVCKDKNIGGSSDNLDKRIQKMKGLLPEEIVKNLHSFRIFGNRATHDTIGPDRTTLTLAIGVIEDILAIFYSLDTRSGRLKKIADFL